MLPQLEWPALESHELSRTTGELVDRIWPTLPRDQRSSNVAQTPGILASVVLVFETHLAGKAPHLKHYDLVWRETFKLYTAKTTSMIETVVASQKTKRTNTNPRTRLLDACGFRVWELVRQMLVRSIWAGTLNLHPHNMLLYVSLVDL
jgi:hypothetical protein